MDRGPQVSGMGVKVAVERSEVILEARGLVRSYGVGEAAVYALRGVDLSVAAGEFVAVMGPSGSGKSTLLYVLGGLCAPTSGDIRFEGRDLARLSDDELTLLRRRRIGFIFQSFNLLPSLTALENVTLPLAIDGVPTAECESRAAEALAAVGLRDRVRHLPGELSGGEQQRVSIARAIAGRPRLLLADEPTGNLDSRNSAQIVELLVRLRAERGHAVLMVTHDERWGAAADRIVRLEDGRVLA